MYFPFFNNEFSVMCTRFTQSTFQKFWNKLLEAYSGPAQIFKMKSFVAVVTGSYPLFIVAKLSILDVCEGPVYASCFSKTLTSIS